MVSNISMPYFGLDLSMIQVILLNSQLIFFKAHMSFYLQQ
jgi:hypothetical protein